MWRFFINIKNRNPKEDREIWGVEWKRLIVILGTWRKKWEDKVWRKRKVARIHQYVSFCFKSEVEFNGLNADRPFFVSLQNLFETKISCKNPYKIMDFKNQSCLWMLSNNFVRNIYKYYEISSRVNGKEPEQICSG